MKRWAFLRRIAEAAICCCFALLAQDHWGLNHARIRPLRILLTIVAIITSGWVVRQSRAAQWTFGLSLVGFSALGLVVTIGLTHLSQTPNIDNAPFIDVWSIMTVLFSAGLAGIVTSKEQVGALQKEAKRL